MFTKHYMYYRNLKRRKKNSKILQRKKETSHTKVDSQLGQFSFVILHGFGQVHQVVQVNGVVLRLAERHVKLEWFVWGEKISAMLQKCTK